ncbi:hypothetical protein ACET3Z_013455 [Daucus carota]
MATARRRNVRGFKWRKMNVDDNGWVRSSSFLEGEDTLVTSGRRNGRGFRWRHRNAEDHSWVRSSGYPEGEGALELPEEGFKLANGDVNLLNDSERHLLKGSILKFWFFLETEVKEAISKDNLQLAKMAIPRLRFLARKVDQGMLKEATERNAQALEKLQEFILQQGLREKAIHLKVPEVLEATSRKKIGHEKKDIMEFIWAHQDLVHQNVLMRLNKNDEESVNLALQHIHYGSLAKAREGNRAAPVQDSHKDKDRLDFKEALLKHLQQSVKGAPSHADPRVKAQFAKAQGTRNRVKPASTRSESNGTPKGSDLVLEERQSLAPTTEGLELALKSDVEKELDRSVVVETWKPRQVIDIIGTLETLGFVNIVVRGISSFKFLLTMSLEEELRELDLELLGWGKVCDISRPVDMDLNFNNPIVTIDTTRPRGLEKCELVNFQGETFKVFCKEVQGVLFESDLDYYEDSEPEDQFTEVDKEDDGSDSSPNVLDGKGTSDIEDNVPSRVSESKVETSPDRGNICTEELPNKDMEQGLKFDLSDNKLDSINQMEEITTGAIGQEGRENARGQSSSSISSAKLTMDKFDVGDESYQNTEKISLSSVVTHVSKLQLGKRRGRPPKKGGRKTLKGFSFKNGKPKKFVTSSIPRNIDSVSSKVLESCLLMGLGLEMCNVEALSHIKDRLKQ